MSLYLIERIFRRRIPKITAEEDRNAVESPSGQRKNRPFQMNYRKRRVNFIRFVKNRIPQEGSAKWEFGWAAEEAISRRPAASSRPASAHERQRQQPRREPGPRKRGAIRPDRLHSRRRPRHPRQRPHPGSQRQKASTPTDGKDLRPSAPADCRLQIPGMKPAPLYQTVQDLVPDLSPPCGPSQPPPRICPAAPVIPPHQLPSVQLHPLYSSEKAENAE